MDFHQKEFHPKGGHFFKFVTITESTIDIKNKLYFIHLKLATLVANQCACNTLALLIQLPQRLI